MSNILKKRALFLTIPALFACTAWAAVVPLKTDKIFVADSKKTGFYVKDGLVHGGDQAINDVIVLDVRYAKQKEYERIVFDLEGNRNGEPTAIERAPYYQADISPDMRRITMTIWGNPKLAFNAKEIAKRLKKSKLISSVDVLPVIEQDRWTLVFNLKEKRQTEVFELARPVRLIVDIAGL